MFNYIFNLIKSNVYWVYNYYYLKRLSLDKNYECFPYFTHDDKLIGDLLGINYYNKTFNEKKNLVKKLKLHSSKKNKEYYQNYINLISNFETKLYTILMNKNQIPLKINISLQNYIPINKYIYSDLRYNYVYSDDKNLYLKRQKPETKVVEISLSEIDRKYKNHLYELLNGKTKTYTSVNCKDYLVMVHLLNLFNKNFTTQPSKTKFEYVTTYFKIDENYPIHEKKTFFTYQYLNSINKEIPKDIYIKHEFCYNCNCILTYAPININNTLYNYCFTCRKITSDIFESNLYKSYPVQTKLPKIELSVL